MVIYFIDILIYSRSETDHIEHLKKVLEVLLENKLYMNLKKYCFITNNLLFFKLYC
jgi:beta-lactamase superfamily II metal-dependent hydrolase